MYSYVNQFLKILNNILLFLFFIKQGLKANVIIPLEEGHLMKSDFSVVNEDSSNRKRSSSLTEQVRIKIYDNYIYQNAF